ncbi:MAG: winged helix-turn-helix domain-containing protein [Nanoarchaeota archaeon]
MSERRNQLEIIYDILQAIQDKGGIIRPTHLLYKSNLSHARMKEYIEQLSVKGMIDAREKNGKQHYGITEQGIKFLVDYKKVRELTEAFGL